MFYTRLLFFSIKHLVRCPKFVLKKSAPDFDSNVSVNTSVQS